MSLIKISLSEISEMKYGKMPDKEILSEDGYPVFSGYRITGYAKEFLYKDPKLVVVARGVGGTGDVKISPPESWITNLAIVLELDESRVDLKYLFYKLQLEPLKEKLNTGAAQAQITINNLAPYSLRIHELPTQKKIAGILTAYDNLIAINFRRMELLEEAARNLYREWFVSLRFPGHEHLAVTDGIPQGWGKFNLIDIAECLMGQSPKSEFYNENGEGLPFHQGVTDFGFRFVENTTYCTALNRIAEAGDILCSVRAPVGRLNITLDKIIIGRGLAALRSRKGYQTHLYYQLKSHFHKEDMIGTGAIFASVTKEQLHNQQLLMPTPELLVQFEDMVKPIDSQIKALHLQNRLLKQARDILLPRLMHGEILI